MNRHMTCEEGACLAKLPFMTEQQTQRQTSNLHRIPCDKECKGSLLCRVSCLLAGAEEKTSRYNVIWKFE